jgi:uncharacterized RDD family membrane protein YckC
MLNKEGNRSVDTFEKEEKGSAGIQVSSEITGEDDQLNAGSFQVYRHAGFWMRLWAYLLDIIVIGSLHRLFIYPVFRAIGLPIADKGIFEPVGIATAIIFYLYFVLMTKYYGQTLGKMVFGLRVVSLKGTSLSWGTVLFREWIGRFISGFIMVAYIVVAFLPKKQGIHDLFADTTVVHEH